MKFINSLLFLFVSFTAFSQTDYINRCGQEALLDEIEISNPGYKQQIENSFKAFNKRKKSVKRSINITVPVHVIVVHPTGQAIGTGSNFSIEHVQSQIDVLNQDFGRYNSDSGNTPPEFPAANTGIQFCLATVDPDGSPTDGITRYAFDGSFDNNAFSIRQETQWPRESYSNIWTAPNLPYLGVATVPNTFSLPPANQDYIHVDAATFGGPGYGTEPGYNLGRTTTHEMGHWLGLLHVWGSGNGSCAVDDNISDTPNQNTFNFGCPNHPSPTCGNSGDMFMNYMDYVDDNCMNAFTQEQGDYMNTILSTSRASLNGASFTSCASVVPLVLTVISQSDPSCSDSNDGSILVEASGGEPNYSYSLDGGVPTSNNLFTDLPGGNYSIEVFDADGNSASVTVFLNTPNPMTATVNVTQTNTCPNDMDGAVEIQVAGGSNPYIYSLDMGMGQQSNTFDSLPNGFYIVNVVDNNGCTFEDVFELTDSTIITITIDSTANLVCGNDDMGLIIASAEGGNGPLSYSINGFEYQDNGEFSELDGGTYFVFVQDSVGCYDSLEVVITEPDPFFISIESNDASCFGFDDGSVGITAFGGNGAPYQYSFDSITFGDTTMLDSLFAGEYDLYALDSLGCLAIATFDIDEPDEIQIFADTIINATCFGDENGMLSLFATGGNGDYTYIFQGDSTSTADYDNLAAGTYDVFAVDALGCEGNGTFEIGISSNISITISSEQMPSCFGGQDGLIQVLAENTQGDVTYSINGGAEQESPIFEGLNTDDYVITAQDSTGCSAAINVFLDEPAILGTQVEITNVICFGEDNGTATVIVSGGTPPYQYSYEPSNTDPSGLAPGNYFVTITDDNGCTTSEEFTITEPDELVVDDMILDIDLKTVTVIASGGVEPFLYSFDGGDTFTDDNVTKDLESPNITVIVKDANGCETISSIIISDVNELAEDWGLKVYPNPFQTEILLDLNFPTQTKATIEIFDIEGRKVYKVLAKKYNSGDNFVKIDLSNFASSIYIVKIASAEGYRYIKVTKM